jgi:hypothetical protein
MPLGDLKNNFISTFSMVDSVQGGKQIGARSVAQKGLGSGHVFVRGSNVLLMSSFPDEPSKSMVSRLLPVSKRALDFMKAAMDRSVDLVFLQK